MKRRFWTAGAGMVLLAAIALAHAAGAQQQPAGTCYTRAQYDAYNAAALEKSPQQRVRLLDEFVAKFPDVCAQLMVPAVGNYIRTYSELRNFPKAVEYADKMLGFGDQIDVSGKFEAAYLRTVAYNSLSYNEKDPTAREQAQKARDAALLGLKLLPQLPKPEGVTDPEFEERKKQPAALMNYTAGIAALRLKDYSAAVDSFKAALAIDPNGAFAYYQMGVAYLQMQPPASLDGFWSLARAISLKVQGEAQVRNYLRAQMYRYQVPACEKLIDSQMSELIALAAASAQRPASYNIPSTADLEKARSEMNVLSLLSDLKGGGDKAKLVWLAACGLEFPEVGGKVIEVTGAAPVILRLFVGATVQEIEAATTANVEARVEGQPEAARIPKDEGARFSGTLAGYTPEPFLVVFEKAKVNAEDIPAPPQPAKKAPTKKAPAKKRPPKAGI